MIALTDDKYIGDWITATLQRDPQYRIVKVNVANAKNTDVINVNGTEFPIIFPNTTLKGAYVKIPADQTGPLTITVKDRSGPRVSTAVTIRITLVALRITNPKEKDKVPLTDTPAMPPLNAAVQVAGYPGATDGVAFNWSLKVSGQWVTRVIPAQNGTWNPYTEQVATGTTHGSETWRPTYTRILGGFGDLSVQATLPGVLDNPVKSDPRWFDIPGANPSPATAKAFVAAQEPTYASYMQHLFCHESHWRQFNPAVNPGEPKTGSVPTDLTPNPAPGRPLVGAPAGIGIAQKDPAAFPGEQWNWQTNALAGIQVFRANIANAQGWAQREQAGLDAKRAAVLARANQNLDKRQAGTQVSPPAHITIARVVVPALTVDQIGRDAIRQYKGGHQYHFDADYVLNPDGVSVSQTGQARWVEDRPGRWDNHPGHGRTAGATAGSAAYEYWLTHAAHWFPLNEPGYLQTVLNCNS